MNLSSTERESGPGGARYVYETASAQLFKVSEAVLLGIITKMRVSIATKVRRDFGVSVP
jgi:hypothetical protein